MSEDFTAGGIAGKPLGPERLRSCYVLALGLLACLTISTQFLLVRTLDLQKRESAVVDAIRQVQMLSQQLTKDVLAIQATEDESQRATRGAELREVIAQWSDANTRAAEAVLTFGNSSEMQDLVAQSQQHAEAMFQAAQKLAARLDTSATTDTASTDTASTQRDTARILEHEPPLLAAMNQIAVHAEAAGQVQRKQLQLAGMLIVSITLILLLVHTGFTLQQTVFMGGKQADHEQIVIHAREQAEKKIAQMSRQMELILNAAGEGIWGVDREGRTTFVNPAAARLTGWDVADLKGSMQHDVLRHSRADGTPYGIAECPVCRTFRDGEIHQAVDDVFWNKDGQSFPVDYRSTPILEGNEIVGAVVTFRNITERRRLQAQLMHAQKLESIGQLAAGIAHEINTPTQYVGDNTRFLQDAFGSLLEVITSFEALLEAVRRHEVSDELLDRITAVCQAAELEYLTTEVPKAIQQSLEGIERVAKIVRAMKEFSHPDAGRKQPTDLNRAIESTITVARNEWKYVAEVVKDFDSQLPPVACLVGEFNQVVLNLIVNAAHAIADKAAAGSSDRGTITVSTRWLEDWVEIRISDTGLGIPQAIRSKIFDPFFTTKPVGKGTGQGLAIAHSVIVDKHAGSISFESELNQGTTFVIRLPIQPDTESCGGGEYEAEAAVC